MHLLFRKAHASFTGHGGNSHFTVTFSNFCKEYPQRQFYGQLMVEFTVIYTKYVSFTDLWNNKNEKQVVQRVKIKLERKLNKPEEENVMLDPEAFNSVLKWTWLRLEIAVAIIK